MSRRHRTSLLLAVLCTTTLAYPAASHAQRVQSVSRAELDAGGWTRLSELMFALRGVARTSVDGITIGGNLTGMPSWEIASGDEWTVLVDGQPVPLSVGGVTVLDLLPVSLAQLDSVTLHRTPTVAGGRIAMHGVLHLFTQRVRSLRASVSHYSGNEAGDPGPFAFTPATTPNVDNSGPFHQARAAYGTPVWDADIAIRRWTDNLTDQRMRARYERAAAPAPPDLWVQQVAPTMRAGIDAIGGRHDVYAGVAQLRGTFFIPAPRQDQSLSTRLAYAGLAGRYDPARGMASTYRLSASQLDARPYAAPLPNSLAHSRRALDGAVHTARTVGSSRVTAGVAATRHSLRSGGSLAASEPVSELEADLLVAIDGGGRWDPQVALTAGRGIGGARGAGVLTVTHAFDARTSIEFRTAASARALGDDGAWIDLALFGMSDLRAERRASASAAAEGRRLVAGGATLAVSVTARHERGLRLVAPDSAATLASMAARTSGPAALTNGELRAAMELPFGGVALGGAAYRYGAPLGGSGLLQDAAGMLPRHLFDASITATPVLDIRVRTAIHLASRTAWAPAASADDTSVPAVSRVDLSLEKWMLARRLRLQVLARNLLNDVERYHPLGADFRVRVLAGATATF